MNESHVLVVDDDARLLRLLQRFLSENGFRITIAMDAEAARKILAVTQPDAMVADITMPGEDGLSLTRSLRENGQVFPIILLTARGEPATGSSGWNRVQMTIWANLSSPESFYCVFRPICAAMRHALAAPRACCVWASWNSIRGAIC